MAVRDARVLTQPAEVRRVPAGRGQRSGYVSELDPRHSQRPGELRVDRERVAGEDWHPDAGARDEQVRDAEVDGQLRKLAGRCPLGDV